MSGEASGAVVRVVHVEDDDEAWTRCQQPRLRESIRGIGDMLTLNAP